MAKKNGGTNMLTEKDYCDYYTCIALRQIGCRTVTEWYIHQPSYERGNCYLCFGIPQETSVLDECDYIPRLSLYEAQKWLREEKKIEVVVLGENYIGGPYHPDVYNEAGPAWFDKGEGYNSYEDALLEGIKKAVKILKEEENGNTIAF